MAKRVISSHTDIVPKIIENIQTYGRFTAYRKSKIDRSLKSTELPDGKEVFCWTKTQQIHDSVGKWICVIRGNEQIWCEVTDYHYNPKRWDYFLWTAVGKIFKKNHQGNGFYTWNDPYPNYKKKKMREIAEDYVNNGDLYASIEKVMANYSDKSKAAAYFRYRKSPTFITMVNEELSKAFKKHNIDEDYLIKMRKDLIDRAIDAEKFGDALKALDGMNTMFSVHKEQESIELPQIGGIAPENMAQLKAHKERLLLQEADEAQIIEDDNEADQNRNDPHNQDSNGQQEPS